MAVTEVASPTGEMIPARVRAINGDSRDDAWIRQQRMPVRQRLFEAGRFVAIGLVGGAVMIFIPLIHLLGVLFLLVLIGFAVVRLRHAAVIEAAGGTCPRCRNTGVFFTGFGRRRFRLPTQASCQACGIELTLDRAVASESLPV